MRTLSDALTAQQTAKSATPYVKFKLTCQGTPPNRQETTYDYSSRLLSVEHHEVQYNDFATVILDNHDRGIASDLRGYWVQIAYGYITGNAVADVEGADSAGNNATAEYSYTPKLWVKYHNELSSRGNLKVILELEGKWVALKDSQIVYPSDNPPGFYQKTLTDTVFNSISALMVLSGFTLDAIGDQTDGIVDSLTTSIGINMGDALDSFDYYDVIIYYLISMTKGYLRSKTGLAFKFIYPQSTDAVKRTYHSGEQYIFSEYMERKKLLIPNHIYVLWGYDEEVDKWTCTHDTVGEASDATEIAQYKDVPEIIKAGELISEAQADARADAIITRRKGELSSGHIVVRHDCAIELYDRIEIDDER